MAIENENNKQNASVGNSKPKNNIPPSDDPAIINPKELATFPKEKKTENPDLDEERDSHLANKVRSEERRGRNITKTGTMPDENGFM
ncbi:hypothetical protein DVK85_01190 [Flavobacterium arcticum]|uniref:Uncharacterized protein n=1 Tax=Flavobacterium arcticum TaxID=1784713 RepID=A0A345H8K7_9FLAO|nr:hypothetical protein [Flavobacterium arcticum]AXG72917.1 hypothetical protein DVK85_01190 [Flavobacterium arcticum]KAF2510418.1 hypothetical protein E0W72_08015 [Flavobacterium arcticum]